METYVQGHDKSDPHVSPVFANLHGLPPLLIHIGSDELQLSSSLKLYEHAKRDSVNAELFVGESMWHNWHLFAGFVPEAKDAIYKMRDFIDKQIKE
jgi:acetyl esterase/lipase